MKSINTILVVLSLLFICASINAQKLPKEYFISADGRMLQCGGEVDNGFYNPEIVNQISITFPQTNWWTLLTNNYTSKTDIPGKVLVNGINYDSVGIRFKGMTSYMGVTGTNSKKSFNLSFDAWKNQKVDGYSTLNLNNSFMDPSFMREMYYYNTIRRHSPAAKCNYAHLFINGIDFGVYQNVQQLNKDFLNQWYLNNDGNNVRADVPPGTSGPGGGWGDGTAAFNYFPDTTTYKKYYTLKSSDIKSVWPDFQNVTRILNQANLSTLQQEIEPYLDLDKTLWHIATECLFSDDDSYIYKGKMDYYFYQDAETWRFQTYDYDGNSIMENNTLAAWSPFYNETKVNYPLLNKLLKIPEIRQRYIHHLNQLLGEYFNINTVNSRIDYFKNIVDSLALADPKKLATYAQFLTANTTLKNFVTTRRNTITQNPEFQQIAPTISGTKYSSGDVDGQAPDKLSAALISTNISHTSGLNKVRLYYGTKISGLFTKVDMKDDGSGGDKTAGDGIYSATIPPQAPNEYVRFYVEAIANNTSNTASYDPPGAEHDVYFYKVKAEPLAPGQVTINEIMASNTSTYQDGNQEFDDWIEFYNNSSSIVDLSGLKLSDDALNLGKWTFPAGSIIQPNDFLVIWADEDGGQGNNHANFKLSATGEGVYLSNLSGQLVDMVDFGQQISDQSFSRIPNGTGSFVIKKPTPGTNNETNSTQQFSFVHELKVYPNPSTDWTNFEIKGSKTDYLMKVHDALGSVVYQERVASSFSLNTSMWPNGVYFISCEGKVIKWIIQH